jgi:hypothetical protein
MFQHWHTCECELTNDTLNTGYIQPIVETQARKKGNGYYLYMHQSIELVEIYRMKYRLALARVRMRIAK